MPDVAASVPVQPASQKPARSQAQEAHDQFGTLVDSNTQSAGAANDASAPAPRRSDNASSSSDRSRSDAPASDRSSQSKRADRADDAPAADDDAPPAAARDAKAPTKTKDKPDVAEAKPGDKSDDAKDGTTDDTADGLDAAVQAADAAAQDSSPTPSVDPNAIVVAAPVVPTDPNAAAQTAATPDSPLTIAAAGIAASEATQAQIAAPKPDTTAGTDKTAAETDAAAKAALADAAATPATGDTAADPQAAPVVAAAVDQGTPKTSFKTAVLAQAKTDISDLGQGAANTDPAAPTTPTAANPAAAHPQAAKPQAEAAATEAKAAQSEQSAAPVAAPSPHHHATATQGVPGSVDAGVQAANAVQAPQTATTSTATASTATLTATAATNTAAVPISGLPIEIAAAARAGKTRFDIRLDPAELGRIDVRIHVDRNGQVTSHLTVEKPETLSMLRQDAPQLQRALDDAGLKTGGNGLSFSLRDQNSSGQNNGNAHDNGGNARRLIISEDDSVAASPVGRGYGRMLGSSGGVDIRV
jgi:flagellar hook-length control protein FliK